MEEGKSSSGPLEVWPLDWPQCLPLPWVADRHVVALRAEDRVKKAGLGAGPGYLPQWLATHHHQRPQKVFFLILNLVGHRRQDHSAHLTEFI